MTLCFVTFRVHLRLVEPSRITGHGVMHSCLISSSYSLIVLHTPSPINSAHATLIQGLLLLLATRNCLAQGANVKASQAYILQGVQHKIDPAGEQNHDGHCEADVIITVITKVLTTTAEQKTRVVERHSLPLSPIRDRPLPEFLENLLGLGGIIFLGCRP